MNPDGPGAERRAGTMPGAAAEGSERGRKTKKASPAGSGQVKGKGASAFRGGTVGFEE